MRWSIKKLYRRKYHTPGQLAFQLLKEGKKLIPDFYRSDLQAEFDKVWEIQKQFYPDILEAGRDNDFVFTFTSRCSVGRTWLWQLRGGRGQGPDRLCLPGERPGTACPAPRMSSSRSAARDRQTQLADRVSTKKNGYGMEMARIISTNDVVLDLVRASVEREFKTPGFRVGPGGVAVTIELKFLQYFQLGLVTGTALADIVRHQGADAAGGGTTLRARLQRQRQDRQHHDDDGG